MGALWAGQAHVVSYVWSFAAVAELAFIVIEPAHVTCETLQLRYARYMADLPVALPPFHTLRVLRTLQVTYETLLKYRYLTGGEAQWERVPIDVGYTEKRWHRLLMIALAMLPSFTTDNVRQRSFPHFSPLPSPLIHIATLIP